MLPLLTFFTVPHSNLSAVTFVSTSKHTCRICEGKEDILQDRIEISHTTARNILREHGTEWRQSKTDL